MLTARDTIDHECQAMLDKGWIAAGQPSTYEALAAADAFEHRMAMTKDALRPWWTVRIAGMSGEYRMQADTADEAMRSVMWGWALKGEPARYGMSAVLS